MKSVTKHSNMNKSTLIVIILTMMVSTLCVTTVPAHIRKKLGL